MRDGEPEVGGHRPVFADVGFDGLKGLLAEARVGVQEQQPASRDPFGAGVQLTCPSTPPPHDVGAAGSGDRHRSVARATVDDHDDMLQREPRQVAQQAGKGLGLVQCGDDDAEYGRPAATAARVGADHKTANGLRRSGSSRSRRTPTRFRSRAAHLWPRPRRTRPGRTECPGCLRSLPGTSRAHG